MNPDTQGTANCTTLNLRGPGCLPLLQSLVLCTGRTLTLPLPGAEYVDPVG